MSDIDTLKADIKKLSARCGNAKMNLHDLSEEFRSTGRTSWMSQATHDAYTLRCCGAQETEGA